MPSELQQIFTNFEQNAIKTFAPEENQEMIDTEKQSKSKQEADNNKKEETLEDPHMPSTKKLIKKSRMTIFDLKMTCSRPDLVDPWDVTAPDPMFLIQLKQTRNTVPVPEHWSGKRRYL